MAYDDLQIVVVFAKELCGSLGYEFMRSSVEAVFTDCVFLIVLFRNTVHICFRRHGLMECGIEYCYVRNARHQFHAGIDSHQVCRIVQRTKISALLDNFDYFVIDDNRVCDLHSAVQNAVSDGIYFFQALDDAALLVYQSVQNHLDCLYVCRHCCFCYLFFAVLWLINEASVDTDSLTESFCQDVTVVVIDQLEFQRGTSAVYY